MWTAVLFIILSSLAVSQRRGNVGQPNEVRGASCKAPPPAPRNGYITISESGIEAYFHCDDGYTLSGKRSTYCRFGDWVPGLPNCTSPCRVPEAPFLGRVTLVGDGREAKYSCEEGYRISGHSATKCHGGEWECCTPKCVPLIPCVNPRIPANGYVLVSGEGSRAEYGCKRGYNLVGPRIRSCNIHGVFQGTRPACVRACPEVPDPENGYAVVKNSGLLIEYVCLPGFSIVGERVRSCQLGQWTGNDSALCLPRNSSSEQDLLQALELVNVVHGV